MASARFVLTLSSVWGHCNDLQGFFSLVCTHTNTHTRGTVKPSSSVSFFFFFYYYFGLISLWLDDAGCCCCRNHHLFKCAHGAHRVRHHHYRYGTQVSPPETHRQTERKHLLKSVFFLSFLREKKWGENLTGASLTVFVMAAAERREKRSGRTRDHRIYGWVGEGGLNKPHPRQRPNIQVSWADANNSFFSEAIQIIRVIFYITSIRFLFCSVPP